MKEIAAVILMHQEKLLICQRGSGGSCAFLWEFPGGKREPNETLEQGAIRECQEELGVTVGHLRPYGQTVYEYPDTAVSITFFLGEILSGELQANVHTAMRWISPSQLPDYPFCPANTEILARLQREPDGMESMRKEE